MTATAKHRALRPTRHVRVVRAERYPPTHRGLAEPLDLPWALRPTSSAESGIELLPGGGTKFWTIHELLRGVTPRMLVWWFSHLDGDVTVRGKTFDRYRLWHPFDHVHASYARRLPDGSVGPGATIRLREVLGRDTRHVVNIITDIVKLDESGFEHTPRLYAFEALPPIPGLARMSHRFTPTKNGTFYESTLTLGGPAWWQRAAIAAFVPQGHGEAWIRHNIEEVGAFEHFLPSLYYLETGRRS